ncbi:Superfamily I DNA or RNA helicase [Tessaracoccus bendigoensis DSM 12906]|uniref:DNA 3'-5' helicase n=1 Tax=Tessaracoccus bendigoensis DSM 12906 TaxID=1123357 RepID=A0A1M6AJ10_9ACTN|nr:ATP-dependent DNA helicase [Tessaracoccus bendigoensis]SHI36462.1 Superfamily I DNA or RNA helicase [Tessaracoccus bendigoensis DSM 12906]
MVPMSFRIALRNPPHLPELNGEQVAAAAPHRGVSVVLGGPGTGKTLVVTQAAAGRVLAGGSLERVIVLAHSRTAAQQLRRDITRRLPRAQTSAQVTTVHGLALGLMRRFWPHADTPWRLMRAPEQESRIRELLVGSRADHWPDEAHAALGTRAFARQLREVLARARQLSLDSDGLAALAAEAGDPLFSGVARFMEEYLIIGDFSGTLDYAELIYRTRLLLTEPDVAAGVAATFDAVIVDDAHELDPAQVALIADLARVGLPVLAVGDPHQRIGGYRGASRSALADLAAVPGARLSILHMGWRNAAEVAEALAGLDARLDQLHAAPAPKPVGAAGLVKARIFDDESAELAHVAAELRHSVTREGNAWSDLVVVTRAGRAQLSAVATALIRLGVPVEVSGDEIALSEQPAVATLLLALSVAARGAAPESDEARLLLASPLCGLDGVAQRGLARSLLASHAGLGTSGALLGRSLREPELLDGLVTPEAEAARDLAGLLRRVSALLAGEAEVQVALWELWDATDWPTRLREQALGGSRRANADLDAIVELFELAARMAELRGAAGALTFGQEVAGQEIPADTGRELVAEGRGVRVITAHRTRGLEWERVWVIGVQEGLWPRLNRAGVMLDPERLSATGLQPSNPAAQLVPERQLFYVACSRARSLLSVSAVQGIDGEGGRPSRFLGELGVPVERVHGSPGALLSTAALVGDLRRSLEDEAVSPGLQRAAALRLARLAEISAPDGSPGFPGSDPSGWWGAGSPTSGSAPPTGPIQITGSSLEALLECPRRWFLARRAKAEGNRQSRASIGDIVHLIARQAAEVGLTAEQMRAELDRVWEQIPFEAEWLSATERSAIDDALDRFARYQDSSDLLAVEQGFRVPLSIGDREVVLVGTVDRLERDGQGRLRVVDLKTGGRIPREAEVTDHAQLGVYQLAASLGAFDGLSGGERRVAPPALAYLRADGALPAIVTQPSIDEAPALPDQELTVGPTWVHDRIAQAVDIIRGGDFDAVECGACRYCQFSDSCPIRDRAGRNQH